VHTETKQSTNGCNGTYAVITVFWKETTALFKEPWTGVITRITMLLLFLFCYLKISPNAIELKKAARAFNNKNKYSHNDSPNYS